MLIFCLFNADVIGNGYDIKCVLCQTYQVIISVTCNDETAAPIFVYYVDVHFLPQKQ